MAQNQMYEWVDKCVNPLAGECIHKCVYCLPGETKILLDDLREIPISKVNQGQKIIGVVQHPTRYNRISVGEVISTGRRIAETITIRTDDDYLECTPEHPLYASSATRSLYSDYKQARAITPYDSLRYIGRPLQESPALEYTRGWLAGYIDGDGCFFNHGINKDKRAFEAASIDADIREYLVYAAGLFGIALREGIKRAKQDIPMIFTRRDNQTRELEKLITEDGDIDFWRGYLAGIIDAEGAVTLTNALRIGQYPKVNPRIYARIRKVLEILSYRFKEEDRGLRIMGGINVYLRIAMESRPRCWRKTSALFIGRTLKGLKRSMVNRVARGTKKEVFNLETTTGSFFANGFLVHNCYMHSLKQRFPANKEKYSGKPRIDEKRLADLGGAGQTVFVGSATDMFAANVPGELIQRIMMQCWKYPDNTYLFQTKNPSRFVEFGWLFPTNSILAVTIEGSDLYELSRAPNMYPRLTAMMDYVTMSRHGDAGSSQFMVSIEPVVRYREYILQWIEEIAPNIISIGANTNRHVELPEPTIDELLELIERMRQITPDVRLKDNLKRILGAEKLAELQAEVQDDGTQTVL